MMYRAYSEVGVSSTFPMGIGVSVYENSLPISAAPTDRLLTLPAYSLSSGSRILFQFFWNGGLNATAGPGVSTSNLTNYDAYQGQTGYYLATGADSGASCSVLSLWYLILDGSQDTTLLLDTAGVFPTTTRVDIQVFAF